MLAVLTCDIPAPIVDGLFTSGVGAVSVALSWAPRQASENCVFEEWQVQVCDEAVNGSVPSIVFAEREGGDFFPLLSPLAEALGRVPFRLRVLSHLHLLRRRWGRVSIGYNPARTARGCQPSSTALVDAPWSTALFDTSWSMPDGRHLLVDTSWSTTWSTASREPCRRPLARLPTECA